MRSPLTVLEHRPSLSTSEGYGRLEIDIDNSSEYVLCSCEDFRR